MRTNGLANRVCAAEAELGGVGHDDSESERVVVNRAELRASMAPEHLDIVDREMERLFATRDEPRHSGSVSETQTGAWRLLGTYLSRFRWREESGYGHDASPLVLPPVVAQAYLDGDPSGPTRHLPDSYLCAGCEYVLPGADHGARPLFAQCPLCGGEVMATWEAKRRHAAPQSRPTAP